MSESLLFLACLQFLQRFGGFVKPLSRKKVCAPTVQTNVSSQSTQPISISSKSQRSLLLPFSPKLFKCSSGSTIENPYSLTTKVQPLLCKSGGSLRFSRIGDSVNKKFCSKFYRWEITQPQNNKCPKSYFFETITNGILCQALERTVVYENIGYRVRRA